MSTKFLTWGTLSLGPVLATVLHDSFSMAARIIGDEVWEVAETVYHRAHEDDPAEAQVWIRQQAYAYLIRAIQSYGVTIKEDCEYSDISNLNHILRALIELDADFQMPELIVAIERQELGNLEAFAEIVAAVGTWVDTDAILELVTDISLRTLPRIYNNCRSLMPPEVVEYDEPVTPRYLQQIDAVVKRIERDSPVVDYYREGNTLGFTLKQYMTHFSAFMSELTEPSELAKNFILILLFTEDLTPENLTDLSRIVDIIVPDVALATEVAQANVKLLKDIGL